MNLKANFTEYYDMDLNPNVSSRLDEYADTMTDNYYLKVESDNEEIKTNLNFLFSDILNFNSEKLWIISRQLLKFGNYYMRLSMAPGVGIFRASELPAFNVVIDVKDNFHKQYHVDDMIYDNHEVAHFRLIRSGDSLPYGESILSSAVRFHKQLQMLEDAMLIKRIIKKEKSEDVDMSDIEYVTKKLIAAIGMKGISDNTELDDVRYQRKLESIKKAIISELRNIAMIHIYTIDKTHPDITNFKLSLAKEE